MLRHTLEHEIHHRGELSLTLGLLGHKGLDA
ncbi:MAG: DinB family protein [Chloroflexi bacterium]|nr:DinB family protein [Chloroflexota bacterium]